LKGLKGFQAGNSGKPKGAVTLVTKDIRDKFRQLLEMITIDQLKQDLMDLEPKDRLVIISGLSEYLVPKLARVEHEGAIELKTVSETTIFQIKPKG
jgi:hypothetical protein